MGESEVKKKEKPVKLEKVAEETGELIGKGLSARASSSFFYIKSNIRVATYHILTNGMKISYRSLRLFLPKNKYKIRKSNHNISIHGQNRGKSIL